MATFLEATPESLDAFQPKALTRPMRVMLWVAGGLVFFAGAQLFLFADATADSFAWTIDPPLTAATLGALYWSAMVLEFWAAQAKDWAHARSAVPGVLVFTALMNVPLFRNLPHLHLDRAVTWVWLAVYVCVPLVMGALLVHQWRQPGADPDAGGALPMALRGVLAAQAAFFFGYGLALMVVPEIAGALWPWELNPNPSVYASKNEPYLGCWLIGLGVVASQVCWENDRSRLRGAFVAYLTIALFVGAALARYPESLDWSKPSAIGMLLLLASIAVVGGIGIRLGRSR